jgi:hypothetical protein
MVLLLVIAAFAMLFALYARDTRRERQQRAAFFGDVFGLLETYRVTQDGAQFPVLEGRYRGVPIKLEPVLDTLAWRKLPSLWLKATVLLPHPARGTLDFLVRPQGGEFYSPSGDLDAWLPVPENWPQHAVLCTGAAAIAPSLDLLTPHMTVFDDPKAKEMLITPRGVRLVYQAAQASRGEYLVLRQARFSDLSLDPALVRSLLDRAIAIAAALDGAAAAKAA